MKLLNYRDVPNEPFETSWKTNLRRVVAVAFLVFLIVEWGSHNLAFAHTYSEDGRAVQSLDSEHEDPCKTMIRCSDGPRQDQNLKVSHDLLQYNKLFTVSLSPRRRADLNKYPRLRRRTNYPLFRTTEPLFNPPKV